MKKEKCENTVKVYLSDGDYIITTIFGSRSDVMNYFRIGNVINNGTVHDNLVKITSVEILFSDNDFS
jgi:hypothetical protein